MGSRFTDQNTTVAEQQDWKLGYFDGFMALPPPPRPTSLAYDDGRRVAVADRNRRGPTDIGDDLIALAHEERRKVSAKGGSAP